MAFATAAGAEERPLRWDIPVPDADRRFAADIAGGGGPLVVISPCSSQRARNFRNWPIENFAAVIKYLETRHAARVILTGGPSALTEVLRDLPADLPAALAIVQHVDEQFMPSFINWLNDHTPLPVRAAQPGDRFEAGTVLVCGRGDHLLLNSDATLAYSREPTTVAYRPSVDVFFESLSQTLNNQSLGILLTGMGRDGAAGLKAMRQRGWHTIAQDQASCAVYGMPKAAVEMGAAAEIIPLRDIGPAAVKWAHNASQGGRGIRKSG